MHVCVCVCSYKRQSKFLSVGQSNHSTYMEFQIPNHLSIECKCLESKIFGAKIVCLHAHACKYVYIVFKVKW